MVYQLFLHQQKSRSRYNSSQSTYLIQYGQRGVYDSITMHTPIFTMYMGTTKSTATKLKTESFDNMFFIHLNKQNAGVLGWQFKLLQSPYSKVRLTSSLPLHPNGRIFLILMCHLGFSCGNPQGRGLVRTLCNHNLDLINSTSTNTQPIKS